MILLLLPPPVGGKDTLNDVTLAMEAKYTNDITPMITNLFGQKDEEFESSIVCYYCTLSKLLYVNKLAAQFKVFQVQQERKTKPSTLSWTMLLFLDYKYLIYVIILANKISDT